MNRYFFQAMTMVIALCAATSANIINVPDDYATIQAGIDASVDGDTVLVQPGTYVENINFNGHNIVLGSLFLTSGDTSYIEQTVIDGDSAGHVITIENEEDSAAVIMGFTISYGQAENGGGIYCIGANPVIASNHICYNTDSNRGGGIYCENSSPLIRDNTISENNGSGMYCYLNSSPEIRNNIISGNSDGGIRCREGSSPQISDNLITDNHYLLGEGGGIYCNYDANPVIANNTISENSARYYGGGIYCNHNSGPNINNNTISGNFCGQAGGAIYCNNSSSPEITDNTISDNMSANSAAAIYCTEHSSPLINNNLIRGNIANGSAGNGGAILCSGYAVPEIADNWLINNRSYGHGGAISCLGFGGPDINNNLFLGNASSWGGAVYCSYSSPSLINNTIYVNVPFGYGGSIFCCNNSDPIVVNTILWADTLEYGTSNVYVDSTSEPSFTFCDIKGGWDGQGNIDAYPVFCDAENSDLTLHQFSPCLGTGEDGADMGAFGMGCVSRTFIIPDDFATIQEGINMAASNDTILVRPGTYFEHINFLGRNIVLGSMYLHTGDTSYISQTILDGDSSGTVVTFETGEDSTALLSGFTLANGYNEYGGGIFCEGASPVIRQNIITGNTSYYSGAGLYLAGASAAEISENRITDNNTDSSGAAIYCEGGHAVISRNTISGNQSARNGAGICLIDNSSATITDNNIDDNQAEGRGGAIYCLNSDPSISDNSISGNGAFQGAGIFLQECSSLIDGNTISGNVSMQDGSGIHCLYSDLTISGNTISDNQSDCAGGIYCGISSSVDINDNIITENTTAYRAGGIFSFNNNVLNVSNNLISGNIAQYGGGIYCGAYGADIEFNVISGNSADEGGGICIIYSPLPESCIIDHNTIFGNYATRYGGGIISYDNSPIITNTILWADSAEIQGNEIYSTGGSPMITYCDIRGGWIDEGNIDAYPMFVDPDNEDFHLLAGSLCIDAGNPHSPYDPDSTITDIGAFYFDQTVDIDGLISLPVKFQLLQNYPNPFNASTRIWYSLPERSQVSLEVYNLLGQRVVTLFGGVEQAGSHNIVWDASGYPSGVYFVRLKTPEQEELMKIMLLK